MVRVGQEHKIDFMLDMVLNHCSTEHEWFQKALAGDQYYQDFSSSKTNQQTGSLSLVALHRRLLGIQGNTTFTSLMRPRLILTGAIPMSVRSFSRLLILAR